MPRTPLEAYAFDARFGKRSEFILDPRLVIEKFLKRFTVFEWPIQRGEVNPSLLHSRF